jgi:hypothetical protein
VASAIHGSPVFLDNPAMAFYQTGSAWRGNIVAFDMESGHSQTLSLPTGLTTLLAAKQETDGFLLAYSVAGSCTVTENSEGEDLYLLWASFGLSLATHRYTRLFRSLSVSVSRQMTSDAVLGCNASSLQTSFADLPSVPAKKSDLR